MSRDELISRYRSFLARLSVHLDLAADMPNGQAQEAIVEMGLDVEDELNALAELAEEGEAT